jgi:ribosomal protein S18 acetylase RimI-like enzyme
MIARLLGHLGILYRWRAAMRLSLAELRERPALPPGYKIVPWDEARLADVAAVDHRAYAGTIDGLLYRGYFATPEGCARMWRECIAGRFGRFDAARSLLLLQDGQVRGDVMAAQTGLQDAFIANLAVDPAHQGGTGRALLLTCLWSYKDAGFRQVGLAVTFDNRRAFHLYQSLGFRVTGRFPILCHVPRAARAAR